MSQIRGYIGTYTKGNSKGIYSFVLDTEKGQMLDPALAAEAGSPTYLSVSKDSRQLFSVIKAGQSGGIAAYQIDTEGRLEKSGEQISEGASPCYVSIDPEGQYLLSANYHRATVDLYAAGGPDGIGALLDTDVHSGSGADPERQEGPHVHFADLTPDRKFIVAVDLGTDQLTTYRIEGGKLVRAAVMDFAPGTGPRHIVFHPSAPFAYVISELSSEVIALHYNADSGRFDLIQKISALPVQFTGHSQGGAIKISPEGRFVYASNRGADTLAVFRTEEHSGKLSLVAQVPTGGAWPRDFEIDPTGRFIVAANQNSGNLVLFARNSETGRLDLAGSEISVPDPVCVKFLHPDFR
ncbi:lactonase family protein [Sporolactobacillus vineae]|uniref:lactonase family protein n=1 Tax=Sporolactobacillus vineae TaxID=444463 RepID=UPI000287DAF0|nr:lactonase family protein [Sporolactobacillus vineae]